MNDAKIDLNLLRLFEALIGERHVSRAASRVGLSQPAMSHALKKLRLMLNDPILVRRGAEMVPTPTALRLSPKVREVLAISVSIVRGEHAFDPATCNRTFQLGMSDYASSLILPGLLSEVRRQAPDVRIHVRHIGRANGVEATTSGEVDLAVAGFFRTDGLKSQSLAVEKYKCAVWRGNRQVKRALTLDHYLTLPHLLVDSAGDTSGIVERELTLRGLHRNVACIVPHFLVAPTVLKGTDMILTLVEGALQKSAAACDLRLLDPPLPLPDYRACVVWNDAGDSDKPLQWLRHLIGDVASHSPGCTAQSQVVGPVRGEGR
jgi:DNA-binding transcriptional LysR family regulator